LSRTVATCRRDDRATPMNGVRITSPRTTPSSQYCCRNTGNYCLPRRTEQDLCRRA